MKLDKLTGYIATGLVCTGVTFGVCWYFMDYSRKDVIQTGEKYKVINEMEEFLESENYDFKGDRSVVNAVNGYFQDTVDKYTFYFRDASDDVEITEYVNTSGTAQASGFSIDKSDDGNILITDIVPGLAADKQGIKQGDVITHINGASVADEKYENIANKLLGKKDTEVTLTIRRGDSSFDMKFVRDHIYINEAWFENKNEIAYIRITHFDQMMQGQLDQAVTESDDYDKAILDLRDNPGGDGDIALDASMRLCGNAAVTKQYYNGKTENYNMTDGAAEWADKDVVIITNEKTASAAEILVANLKQNLNVTIVGTTTVGKGIFQQEKDLSDGGHLHYTAGYYTVGDWECYQDIGITPDVEVPMDRELIGTDDDVQLKKALDLLD